MNVEKEFCMHFSLRPVSSATSSDADSASAFFSSSDYFELIIRIVL